MQENINIKQIQIGRMIILVIVGNRILEILVVVVTASSTSFPGKASAQKYGAAATRDSNNANTRHAMLWVRVGPGP